MRYASRFSHAKSCCTVRLKWNPVELADGFQCLRTRNSVLRDVKIFFKCVSCCIMSHNHLGGTDISLSTVTSALTELDTLSAINSDGISQRFLKSCEVKSSYPLIFPFRY